MCPVFIAAALLGIADANVGSIVDIVNHANTTWQASASSSSHLPSISKLCGTFVRGDPRYKPPTLPLLDNEPQYANVYAADLPTNFDLRTVYGSNCTVISKIRDQSACGSCWAFSATEAFEDRRCIANGEDLEFSALDVASNSGNSGDYGNGECAVNETHNVHSFPSIHPVSQGCTGGQPYEALGWMVQDGIVTGGDYNDTGTCLPYAFAPCAHHVPATTKYVHAIGIKMYTISSHWREF
jgi:cathepsin B